MANAVKPRGAQPYGQIYRAQLYVSGGAVYPGDFVSTNSSGQVVAASASSALLGVAANYTSASGKDLLVYDHPDQMFVVQSDDTNPGAQTDFNLNYDIVATSGNTTYNASRMALDGSTGATTATLPLKALSYEKRPDNALSAECDVVVLINNHQLKGGTGTAGT